MTLATTKQTKALEYASIGQELTLASSAARTATAGTNGTAFPLAGIFSRVAVVCTFTAKATEVDDTCDVYVDVLIGSTWINAIHFTRALGNGTDAATEYAILDPTNPGTDIVVATADAASAKVRPSLFGSQIRARWVIVDAGGTAASFTFSVTGYAIK